MTFYLSDQMFQLMNDGLDKVIVNFLLYCLNNYHQYDVFVMVLYQCIYLLHAIHKFDKSCYIFQKDTPSELLKHLLV